MGSVSLGSQRAPPLISVVVPVYKEENNIRPFLARAVPALERLGSYEILFALDPSPDNTERVIREEVAQNRKCRADGIQPPLRSAGRDNGRYPQLQREIVCCDRRRSTGPAGIDRDHVA